MKNFLAISWCYQVTFWWNNDDDVHLVLDQHAEFYRASSLKQGLLVDMSLLSNTLFWFRATTSLCSYSLEATNTNLMVVEPTTYRNWGEYTNHYTSYVVSLQRSKVKLLLGSLAGYALSMKQFIKFMYQRPYFFNTIHLAWWTYNHIFFKQ